VKPEFKARPYNVDLTMGVGASLKIADQYAITGSLDYLLQAFDSADDHDYKLRANQLLLSMGLVHRVN
jgi:hypothetical protein